MNTTLKILGFLFVCLLSTNAFSQKGWELGGWLGTSYYFGDLNTDLYLGMPGLSGGLNVRRNFNERVCLKASLNYGRLRANDNNSENFFQNNRNLSFYSDVFDFTPQIEFNFLPYLHGSRDDFFTPYLLAGFSVFRYSPKAELDGEVYSLRNFGTEGQLVGEEYKSISGAFTFGGGFKMDINRLWSINIEFSTHRSFTDHLDDVSTVYPNQVQLTSRRGPTASALSDRSLVPDLGGVDRQRGNEKNNDTYVLFGVSIMRYFGRLECPKISDI